MMTSFYYYDQNPSGLCYLVQIRAFVIETSLELPNLNMKGKTKRILLLKLRANGRKIISQQLTTLLDVTCCVRLCLFIYLFTSFSGHRPAQRECGRAGLRSHASCHPYPTPQPVKVGHTTGVYNPYSFRIVMWVLLRPTRTNQ